ncbi:hypothetical protein FKX85_16805 [Echinicola soli]|uniref:Uncharacterized protein n=1 Tax=Echinicola soli TaxID=2591634 RepID=A0A514CLB0_9BACT|nr:hypothetical protein [Echinicola soli]QDH80611.1 hypothetical protein FKX85_16805 [Echinicola soli]
MSFSEQQYIALCRKQIEEKFIFGNGSRYTQRDLELLSQNIEEKTGVVLSLSTLKRLWKDDFKQSPQLATLNALAAVLDYRDWQDFKLHNHPKAGNINSKKNALFAVIPALILAAALAIALIIKLENRPHKVQVDGSVHFSAQKTVLSGTPTTVIFNYDLSQVAADSFFIQQSWNPLHRVPLDPEGNTYSAIYYEAGYHRARLIANDSVLAMQPVHILSNGWEPHLYYNYRDRQSITFKNEHITSNGYLHISEELLRKKNIDFSRQFETRTINSRIFHTSSDHFNLTSRIKLDHITSDACPFMQIMVVTEKHIFWVNLQNKGCERNASYKMGEIIRSGNENNLSSLGVDVYNWQEINIKVENKHAEIILNGEHLFQEIFQEDFGDIMALTYIFNGTGSVDYVRLEGAKGETVFQDDFD